MRTSDSDRRTERPAPDPGTRGDAGDTGHAGARGRRERTETAESGEDQAAGAAAFEETADARHAADEDTSAEAFTTRDEDDRGRLAPEFQEPEGTGDESPGD
ncbi:hypothetical protein ACU639_27950 [Streptomyces cynarae]|uniref:hypothetical protein n=1 Tax=Streptomyces cynarae TaxID=2981134 RepID=UPI00406C4B63